MIRLWPQSPADQLTPRAEKNPFNDARFLASGGPLTPTAVHPLLSPYFSPAPPTTAAVYGTSGLSDLTPLPSPSAQPTTHLSLHAPVFNIMQPPPGKKFSSSPPSSIPPPTTAPGPAASKGQIHVKLIQARGLNVRSSLHARPYVVVQFEQNEFVSRDPIPETDKEVKGTAVNLSRQTSSVAINALGAIGSKAALQQANRRGSKDSSPSSSLIAKTLSASPHTSAAGALGGAGGLFGRLSAHNPVWKHEVSFDVTSEASLITLNVYDRSVVDQGFLGTVQIKPVIIHDHTVDQWYKLRPFEDEIVSGEMRVQITYEAYKTKRALTPRDFEFLKLIGRGTFGKVFQVRKKDTKRIYAMKVLSKKEIVAKKEVAHTIGERKILQRSLESPFLVGLKFSFQTDTDLYLVTDFKSGGELFWHLQRETRFSEERARFYIAELILALEHLHKYNIVYRDLKPENILLDATGHVALCDFGLSKADLRPDELTTTFCGTTEYLAPEILLDEHGYSKIVDFWSLGVLLFEMCCGWSPFYAEDTQQMYKNICFGKIRFPKGVICDDGKQFVKGLLNRNPKHRLGAQRDAAELKEHPFFASVDWTLLAAKQVTPPFKPVVESDESTNNFDPEFTSADMREVGVVDMLGEDAFMGMGDNKDMVHLDEEDPSEAWVSQSLLSTPGYGGHQPQGPLGSERPKGASPLGPLSPAVNVNGHGHGHGLHGASTNGASSTSNGTGVGSAGSGGSGGRSAGIQIKQTKKSKFELASTPLTSSVQENFRGFTYHGGESVVAPMLASMAARRAGAGAGEDDDEEGKDDDQEQGEEDGGPLEPTTEDEIDDCGNGKSVGRYATKTKTKSKGTTRRKGVGFMDEDDDMS